MKILYISQYFPPEMGAPASRVSELARHWVKAGHEVTVLTGFPNHPTGKIHPDYRSCFWRLISKESWAKVHVVRTWLLPVPNRRAWERMANYLSFLFSAAFTGSFLQKPDVVIATSPQLFVGLAGYWVSRVKRIPLVFEIRDLWPESITASGMGKNAGLALRALAWTAEFLYRKADRIVVVTPAFRRELIEKHSVDPEKISIVLNGVETALFDGCEAEGKGFRAKLGLDGAFVVSYIGTLGMAHGLETLLETAGLIQDEEPRVRFLLVGAGAERANLEKLARERKLENVVFSGPFSRDQIPKVIAASDVCTVLLRKTDVFKTVIPTKMLEFMAGGRPVILGVEGQAKEILDAAGGGISVEPENVKDLAAAVLKLFLDRSTGEQLGRNGKAFIRSKLTREKTANTYLDALRQVA